MPQRKTTIQLQSQKGQTPIVCLTCYTAPMAELLDPHVDILLVGDTVGMVLYGMDTTLGVTVEMMIEHGKAVMRKSERACVVVDMPFASYQMSKEHAFANAARIMAETGCSALKLEGGQELAETVSFLVTRGIPIVGHIGVMPQHVHQRGGYRFAGKTEAERQKVKQDAKALEEAGAFSLVLECVEKGLAKQVTDSVSIPTIGIGSSVECDGQVLVTDDLLGLSSGPIQPRFVKRYAEIADIIQGASQAFSQEVKLGVFPEDKHSFVAASSKIS